MDDNIAQIRRSVAFTDPEKILDLGCWNGETTSQYVPTGATVVGVESNRGASEDAHRRFGWEVVAADLNEPLPFDSEVFDVVTSNQVLEHLADTDTFMAEAFRVLRPGGVAVISTENLASWHNIASLLMGWQAFSLTNVSRLRSGIGNPLANLRSAEPQAAGWAHQRLFSYRGLAELATACGFIGVQVLGAGYYPLPTAVAHLDPRHAAFITVVGNKAAAT